MHDESDAAILAYWDDNADFNLLEEPIIWE